MIGLHNSKDQQMTEREFLATYPQREVRDLRAESSGVLVTIVNSEFWSMPGRLLLFENRSSPLIMTSPYNSCDGFQVIAHKLPIPIYLMAVFNTLYSEDAHTISQNISYARIYPNTV